MAQQVQLAHLGQSRRSHAAGLARQLGLASRGSDRGGRWSREADRSTAGARGVEDEWLNCDEGLAALGRMECRAAPGGIPRRRPFHDAHGVTPARRPGGE